MFGKGVLYIMSLGNSDKDVRLAQLDRASDYGSEGREFESSSARCQVWNLFQTFFYFQNIALNVMYAISLTITFQEM